jgi:hypothetical protein
MLRVADQSAIELSLFEEVAEIVRGMMPSELGEVRCRPRRYGIKVWFGAEQPPREHYEAQVIGPKGVEGASVVALELGFHAEHPQVAANDAVLARLAARERTWRRTLGREAVAGPFIGRADVWRRVSETWPDPDLSAPDVALEIGARLMDYITALESCRRT